MSDTTEPLDLMTPEVGEAFQALADLEKDFAAVELDALRAREYALKELYSTRAKHLSQIPNFWPTVITHGPQEFQDLLGPNDEEILDSITSLKVERYQIVSDREGEPRSLRFTFEFDPSAQEHKLFEDTVVVKEFEFVARDDLVGGGGYVSKPVNFSWTKAGKKKGLNRFLDLSEQLYQAEGALVQGQKIEEKEREGLWQYEKLKEELEKMEDKAMEGDDSTETSILDFFGYRGAVKGASEEVKKEKSTKKPANGDTKIHEDAEEEESDEEDDEDDEDEGLLDVEIFPLGAEIASCLAEDLWPNVMDYFMKAQTEEEEELDFEEDEIEEEDGDAPQLVEFGGFDDADADEAPARPTKKARTS